MSSRSAVTAAVFLALIIQPAWGSVSSGQNWELFRSAIGESGSEVLIGGTDKLSYSMGEAYGTAAMNGGTDSLIPGYLTSFTPTIEMLQGLSASGNVSSAGTVMVLASNDPVKVGFTVDVDSNTLAYPTAIRVAAKVDAQGNPISTPWATNLTYDQAQQSASVAPAAGNWSQGTSYEIYVSTDIKDLDGTPRTRVTTFTFTTVRDPLADNVAVVPADPAIRIPIAANTFSAPYVIALSTGTDSQAVREANDKAAAKGPEHQPLKIVQIDSYDTSGQPWAVPLAQSVPLTLTYADVNGDGIVDGTNPPVRAKSLAVWRLDERQNLWVKQWGATVDQSGKKVIYPTNHFSVYGLFGARDTDVSDTYAFPVPFRPNAGNSARYGTWAEGIKFTNLPSEGVINIYTLSGQRVRSLGITAPLMAWDVRNEDGTAVASGLYIWEVKSGDNRKTGKLVIIK